MSSKEYINAHTGQIYQNADEALQAHKEQLEELRKEGENKNPPFIQLTKGVSPSVIAQIANESGVAVQVLMFFFENMDDFNVLMVSQQIIAEKTKRTRKAVGEAIKILEKYEAIGIGKISNANVYLINPHVAWQKAYKQRNIAVLKGNIILGRSENEKLFKRFHNVYETSKENNLKMSNLSTKIIKEQNESK